MSMIICPVKGVEQPNLTGYTLVMASYSYILFIYHHPAVISFLILLSIFFLVESSFGCTEMRRKLVFNSLFNSLEGDPFILEVEMEVRSRGVMPPG